MRSLSIIGLAAAIAISFPTQSIAWDPLGLDKTNETIKEQGERLERESTEWRKEMNKTRETVSQSLDMLSRTVPGERYLRLIDDLNSQDQSKVDAARAFLKKLANIDVDVPYVLSISFKYDTGLPFKMDFNRFGAPHPPTMQAFVDYAMTLSQPKSTIMSVESADQIKQKVKEVTRKALAELLGTSARTVEPPAQTGHPAR